MVYYANGGFNWHDVYYMPIKLREFYYRELAKAKDTEKEQMDAANRKSNAASKVRRR
jgi:hypothetical protein